MANSGEVNRIAFVDDDGQLCTVAPTGGDKRVVVRDGRFCQFPAWSPDSSLIATISSDRRSAGIVITGDAPERITAQYVGDQGPPVYLYWSPDGRYVSFIAASDSTFGLHLLDMHGERLVRAYGQPFFWSFAPDGQTLLTNSDGPGAYGRLERMPTDSIERGAEMPVPGYFQAPAIASDGNLLAFATMNGEQSRLLVTRLDGETVASLEYPGMMALDWSPREPLLAFTHPDQPTAYSYGPLQLLDTTNNAVQLLVSDDVLAFFWSPDGSAIAFVTVSRAPSRATRQAGYSSLADTSAVADFTSLTLSLGVVNLSDGDVQRLARFEPQPTFVNQFLPFFDQYARSHRLWSPDSQAIVLPVMARSGVAQIAVVPRDGSRASIIADGSMACWSTR